MDRSTRSLDRTRAALASRCGIALLAGALTAASLSAHATETTPGITAGTTSTPALTAVAAAPFAQGVYTGPGPKGPTGAAEFSRFSGAPVTRVLDFLPLTSWLEMTRNSWLLTPYTGTGYQLELSVPMLPNTSGVSLAACANGDYNTYWTSIATSLVSARLEDTVVRPGWEMNGAWYKWSAIGKTTEYIGCFRRLVTAMRSVPGQELTFTWTPNVGDNPLAGELAYPGDAYVDEVSIDVYDTSWTWYPTPAGYTTSTARTNAWNYLLKGSRGLNFWSTFARSHAKRFGVSEWGVTWRSDGHGGGDNGYWVDRMADWMADPANGVSYANYFNSNDTATLKHNILRTDTVFPDARKRYVARMPGLVSAQTSTAPEPASAGQFVGVAAPRVIGKAAVGRTLTATVGTWRPTANGSRFQWYAAGRPISGATARTYRPRRQDAGKRLRVLVTVDAAAYLPAHGWSAPTRRVRP